ncbi:hypothetical protein [Massilia sp. Root418]|uniref:hypothetical protein n=1 Tax=Massilia sp. Root418 TaxID=1736532 RepID=UPI000AA0FEDF|nr:hypothetical protein [Massilia sp. Root418]
MNWLRAVACSGFLVLAYANAAHSDERVREQMLATGESPIKCAIDLAKSLPAGSSAGQMLLVK